MQYFFGLVGVLCLVILPVTACNDLGGAAGSGGTAGTGGNGGSAETGGTGGSAGVGGAGGIGGTAGMAGDGGSAGTGGFGGVAGNGGGGGTDPCENASCDDTECRTDGTCDPRDGMCAYDTLAEDGTSCGAGAGVCQGGMCVATFPCTEQGIRDAITLGGGPHTFACDGPTTVMTEAEIVIDNDVILDGEANLTLDGSDGYHRMLSVSVGVTATLRGFSVMGGAVAYPQGGGGIFNGGNLRLEQSTVRNNTAMPNPSACGKGGPCYGIGGGINNQGELVLLNSTVSENTAQYGGGISSGDPFTGVGNSTLSVSVVNSTVSDNSALFGGGILGAFTISVTNSTVSGNTAPAGGSCISGFQQITVTSSLVDGDCYVDMAFTTVTSSGHNIESPGDTCGFKHATDQVNVSAEDLKLGPLQDNGGPTMTHALLPGSIAIDVIPAEECLDADGEPLTTDQRGEPRPGGTMCDVGSFEVQQESL